MNTLTPFIRYGLMLLAMAAVRGGWLPEETANEIASDPAVIELVAGIVIWAGTFLWYLYSKSRKALVEAIK